MPLISVVPSLSPLPYHPPPFPCQKATHPSTFPHIPPSRTRSNAFLNLPDHSLSSNHPPRSLTSPSLVPRPLRPSFDASQHARVSNTLTQVPPVSFGFFFFPHCSTDPEFPFFFYSLIVYLLYPFFFRSQSCTVTA